MATAAQEVLARYGSVDLLFNNAGITLTPTPFLEIDEALLRRVIDVNMWGVYNGIREFLPALLLRPKASIVNVSSLAGLLGLYGHSP